MQQISVSKLAGLGLVSFAAGFAVSEILVGFGSPFPVAPASITLSLVVIGIATFAASFPIAQYRRAREKGLPAPRPNSITAFRILIFARASIITATGFLGWFLGQLGWLFVLGNPVSGLVFGVLQGGLGALAMLTLSVFAELNCRVPKDPEREVKS